MTAWIKLNGNDYFITWYEDKFGAAAGIGQKMKYMKVKNNPENYYKVFKTLVYFYNGAKGAYNWLVLCSHFQSNMELAEKFIQHVIANGRGIR